MEPLLKVENLHVRFASYAGNVHAVRGVSFEVGRGEVLAIVARSWGWWASPAAAKPLPPKPR